MLPTLIALAISTILNTVYFLKTVIRLYTPVKRQEAKEKQYRTVTNAGSAGEGGGPDLLYCIESDSGTGFHSRSSTGWKTVCGCLHRRETL